MDFPDSDTEFDEFKDKYDVIVRIGSGTYSDVIKCRSKKTREIFACKQLKRIFQTWPQVHRLSEVKTLCEIPDHPNILRMVELHFDPAYGRVSMIFDLMDFDLFQLIKDRQKELPESRVKKILVQILCGLDHIHKYGIFHRDIKPENILVKKIGDRELIVLGDFGSVHGIDSTPPFTQYISTRWYRSPECILTSGYYGSKMDIWAAGCIFFEILTLTPLFPGTTEIDQINKIHDILGPPPAYVLQKFFKLYHETDKSKFSPMSHARFVNIGTMLRGKSKNFAWYAAPKDYPHGIEVLLPDTSRTSKSLLYSMLKYDPDRRPTAETLLEHEYFKSLKHQTFANKFSEMVSTVSSNVFGMLERAKAPVPVQHSPPPSHSGKSKFTKIPLNMKPVGSGKMKMKNTQCRICIPLITRMFGTKPLNTKAPPNPPPYETSVERLMNNLKERLTHLEEQNAVAMNNNIIDVPNEVVSLQSIVSSEISERNSSEMFPSMPPYMPRIQEQNIKERISTTRPRGSTTRVGFVSGTLTPSPRGSSTRTVRISGTPTPSPRGSSTRTVRISETPIPSPRASSIRTVRISRTPTCGSSPRASSTRTVRMSGTPTPSSSPRASSTRTARMSGTPTPTPRASSTRTGRRVPGISTPITQVQTTHGHSSLSTPSTQVPTKRGYSGSSNPGTSSSLEPRLPRVWTPGAGLRNQNTRTPVRFSGGSFSFRPYPGNLEFIYKNSMNENDPPSDYPSLFKIELSQMELKKRTSGKSKTTSNPEGNLQKVQGKFTKAIPKKSNFIQRQKISSTPPWNTFTIVDTQDSPPSQNVLDEEPKPGPSNQAGQSKTKLQRPSRPRKM